MYIYIYIGTFVSVKDLRNTQVNFYFYKPSQIYYFKAFGEQPVSRTDGISPGETACYTLCLEAVHCRMFLQIHAESTLFPSNSVKVDSLLVAYGVVSVADCFVTFRWNIKSNCKR